MTFDKEDYGKAISEELARYLKQFTDQLDISTVNRSTGIGITTIKYIISRNNSITEYSSKAIIELMIIAKENSSILARNATYAKKALDRMIINGVNSIEVIDHEEIKG